MVPCPCNEFCLVAGQFFLILSGHGMGPIPISTSSVAIHWWTSLTKLISSFTLSPTRQTIPYTITIKAVEVSLMDYYLVWREFISNWINHLNVRNNSAINIYDTADVIMVTRMHTVLEPGTSSAHLSAS